MANTLVVDDSDDEFILVGFADEQQGEYRDAVHFQRTYGFDEQDMALGMDHIYVERGLQSGSGYGGIKSVELYATWVRILLIGQTAKALEDTEFKIHFNATDNGFRRPQRGLRAVFDGFDILAEHVE